MDSRIETMLNSLRVGMREPMAIMKKEFISYFVSPIAYIVITLFLIFTGIFFWLDFFLINQAEMRDFFQYLPLFFSFVAPAVTMRLFAEEMHTGSIEILMTLPVTPMKVVVGKFLAGTAFMAIMLVPTLIYLITILILGSPDFGPIIGGYIGAMLLGGAYTSIGLLTSSLSRSQIIALITGIAACFFFWFLGWIVVFLPSWLGFLEYFSTDFHFKNISRGIIDSRNIIYFLSIIVISLLLTAKIMEKRR